MANSPLVQFVHPSPNHSGRRTEPISKITIHHWAGVGTHETLGEIFRPVARQASCNYGVDRNGVISLHVDEANRSWCSSSNWNDQRAVTIEVSNSSSGEPWPVSDHVLERTIELCVDICQRNGMRELVYTGDRNGSLTEHRMFWATSCPGTYLHGKMPWIAEEVTRRLNAGTAASTTAGIPIMAEPSVTIAQMETWARENQAAPFFVDLAETFYNFSEALGVDPAVSYALSSLETAWGQFGGVLDASFKNPCGMKTGTGGSDSDPGAHMRFASWEEGIIAEVHHLALYAGTRYEKSPDPRHFKWIQGQAKTVEELGGRWAPSDTYGERVAARVRAMREAEAEGDEAVVYKDFPPGYYKALEDLSVYHEPYSAKTEGRRGLIPKGTVFLAPAEMRKNVTGVQLRIADGAYVLAQNGNRIYVEALRA